MRLFSFLCLLFVAVAACAQEKPLPPPGPQIQQIGPHNTIVIEAVGSAGHYIGFDVRADGALVAPVRFTSRELIFSSDAVAVSKGAISTLVFDDLQGVPDCGITLKQSRVVVTLNAQQFPTVAFDLHLTRFSTREWQETLGMQPFHFLTIGLPEATVWHQRGWLHATPRADMFPLLLDVHANTPELSAFPYNREWSLTPPLSAHALPVIGLWSPARRLYAGWNFQASRLSDNSERDIATGFCNRLIVPVDLNARQPIEETQPPAAPLLDDNAPHSEAGKPPRKRDPRLRRSLSYDQQASRDLDKSGVGKFIALVYPQGGSDYQQLVYPTAEARMASCATLMFHTDMGADNDPNRFLWQEWWNAPAIRNHLARVPAVANVNRPASSATAQSLRPSSEIIRQTEAGDKFHIPGSLLMSGQDETNESAVDAALHSADPARWTQLQTDAQTLLHYVKKFTVNKEPCAYWEQPLAGEATPEWGGEPATTLHNAQGWAAGRLLLDLYRVGKAEEKRRKGEKEKDAEEQNNFSAMSPLKQTGKQDAKSPFLLFSSSPLLPVVDGVFNWSRHVAWTRGTFADSPTSQSASDSGAAIGFLLDYYFTFKDDLLDEAHRTRAQQALELAQTFMYRSLVLWTGQGNKNDAQESAFLWEMGAGRDHMGAVSGCEIKGSLDALAQVAVHTGDPILMWALQGSLSRPAPPRINGSSTLLTDLETSGGKLLLKPAPGTSRIGSNQREASTPVARLNLIAPLGDTNARILCGEKAALVINQDAQRISIRNYRCTGVGDFALIVRMEGAGLRAASKTPPVSVTVTFPYADLSRKTVAVRHGSITQQTLVEGANLERNARGCWSLIVRGLRDGDTIVVGKPDLSGANFLPTVPPLLQSP